MVPSSMSGSHGISFSPSAKLDRLGMMASLACAAHCAVMPLAVGLLPLLGLGFLKDERLEWILVGTSAGLGMGSLIRGYRCHQQKRPLVILALGLALLISGRLAEATGRSSGVILVVAGGIIVAMAHYLNQQRISEAELRGALDTALLTDDEFAREPSEWANFFDPLEFPKE